MPADSPMVLVPPAGEVLTENTVPLLREGDRLRVILPPAFDGRRHEPALGDIVICAGSIPHQVCVFLKDYEPGFGWHRSRFAFVERPSASPARGEGDAPPHGYLVKDFADGWFWTRDASLACADGAAVWSLQHGRYETSTRPTPATPAGWIVSNANGDRWRTWEGGFSAWTDDREKATRYARREDAEAVHAEDEDAWRIEPYGPATPAGEELREAIEHLRECVKLVPAPGAIERAEAFLAALQPQAEGE